ncbi:MAG: PIN domain-containing protein [Verrucomicrobiales bacterium]|nr:PIN domain-containing protein [Verrucomicrobiales bacterium]
MVSRPVMVDSCWYIQQAREGQDPLQQLGILAASRDIATCGVVQAEVGRGLRVPRHLKAYRRAWSVMCWVESNHARWEETLDLAWSLDRRGVTLPLQDIHIAVCARHIGAVVLTYDQHFQHIPGIDATDRIF